MLLLTHSHTDPAFNLACEEYFLTQTELELDIFWRNGPSVIVGRNQNTLAEVDPLFTTPRSIRIARRMTGGGAVFHDLGNINYTHIRHYGGPIDLALFSRPMADCLRAMGFDAVLSGRNDILVGGHKVSGAAQTARAGRLLHHGTLLYGADLSLLAGALRVRPEKYAGRAVASVSARVANLSDCLPDPPDTETFLGILLARWAERHPSLVRRELTGEETAAIERLAREKYAADAWTYGLPTPYNFHGSCRAGAGGLEAFLQVKGGRIRMARLHGDFFSSEDITGLAEALVGLAHRPGALREALTPERLARYLPGFSREEVLSALV